MKSNHKTLSFSYLMNLVLISNRTMLISALTFVKTSANTETYMLSIVLYFCRNENIKKIPSQKSRKLTSNERKRQSYTRRQWSDEEKEAVATFFERQRFTTERPGKKEFDACIKAHRVLNARTWLNVKDYFYNTFRRK